MHALAAKVKIVRSLRTYDGDDDDGGDEDGDVMDAMRPKTETRRLRKMKKTQVQMRMRMKRSLRMKMPKKAGGKTRPGESSEDGAPALSWHLCPAVW